MMPNRVYLDYNASAPPRPEVTKAVTDALACAGNASSVHAEGRRARALIEEAREQVAELTGAPPASIIFTSGGTEASAFALSPQWLCGGGSPRRPLARLFVSAIEHPSVLAGGQFAPEDVERLPVTSRGAVDLAHAARRLESYSQETGGAPFMVSLMLANNETGAVQPVAGLAAIAHRLGGIMHTDAVQGAGKMAFSAAALQADLISLSAHKLAGPKGVGALIVASDRLTHARPLLRGGGQEMGRRGGTENVPGIAGFGAAAEIAQRELASLPRTKSLRDRLEAELRCMAPETIIFSESTDRLVNTTSFAVPGMQAETLVIALDLQGIAVSAGSACASGKVAPSHVLGAMGASRTAALAAIRVSLGWGTAMADIERFLAAWSALYARHKDRLAAA